MVWCGGVVTEGGRGSPPLLTTSTLCTSFGAMSVMFYVREASVEALEAQYGELVPTTVMDKTKDDKDVARNKFMACLFLSGIDTNRYGKVLDDLNSQYLKGSKQVYPKLVAAVAQLLMHQTNYEGVGRSQRKKPYDYDDDEVQDTSFAQVVHEEDKKQLERVYCRNCGGHGHFYSSCSSPHRYYEDDGHENDESDVSVSDVEWSAGGGS